MNFSKAILLAAVACAAPLLSQAATVTSNPTLSVGDFTFNNFGCSISKGGVYATPSNCNQINVNTITAPGTGIEFSSGFTALPFSFDDAVLKYDVSSKSGISKVGLDFNGTFFGLGISTVTESIFSGSDLVGFAKVSCGTGIGCSQSDSIMLNGVYNDLHIVKDVNVTAAAGFALSSAIDQTFTATPEPSSLALMGSGLLAAAGLLRRKAKKA